MKDQTEIVTSRIVMATVLLSLLTCVQALSDTGPRLDGYACYEVELSKEGPEIGWARSGAWAEIEGQRTLLLVDARKAGGDGQILSISTNGEIRPGFGSETGVGFKSRTGPVPVIAPSHMHSDGRQGIIILDDGQVFHGVKGEETTGGVLHLDKDLQWLDSSPIQVQRRPIKSVLPGVQEVKEVSAIFDMVSVAGGLLFFSDYIGVDDEWHSGFVHRGKNGDQVVDEVTSLLAGIHYAREMPYLAAITEEGDEADGDAKGDQVAFILFMDERPSLGKVVYEKGAVKSFEKLTDFPQEFRMRPLLVPQPDMRQPEKIALYYKTMESAKLAAGIFSWGGELYLLGKDSADRSGKTAWFLILLDQNTGEEISRVRVPTDAPHLVVTPGDYWAFLELGSAQEGFGPRDVLYMETESMVLVPDSWLRDPFGGDLESAARAHCRNE